MKPKVFPYLQALYFGVTNLIDHFSTFFYFALIWTGIWIIAQSTGVWALIQFIKGRPPGLIPWTLFHALRAARMGAHWTTDLLLVASVFLGIMLFYYVLYYYLLRIAFSIYKAEPLPLRTVFFSNVNLLIVFVGARLLYLIRVIGGTVCLIVPGFYFVTRDFFSGFTLLHTPATTLIQDFYQAQEIACGYQWQLLFVFMVHTPFLAGLAGLLPAFFITVLFVLPVKALIEVHLYHTLRSASREQSASSHPMGT